MGGKDKEVEKDKIKELLESEKVKDSDLKVLKPFSKYGLKVFKLLIEFKCKLLPAKGNTAQFRLGCSSVDFKFEDGVKDYMKKIIDTAKNNLKDIFYLGALEVLTDEKFKFEVKIKAGFLMISKDSQNVENEKVVKALKGTDNK